MPRTPSATHEVKLGPEGKVSTLTFMAFLSKQSPACFEQSLSSLPVASKTVAKPATILSHSAL
eukprot:3129406-Pyramimonas_sp.AAC.1